MANTLLSEKDRCAATTQSGAPCGAPHISTSVYCVMHDKDARAARRRAVVAGASGTLVHVDLDLNQLAHADVTKAEGLSAFRTGLIQHLLAGTIEPPVARAAIDVAETIARTTRKVEGPSATADVMRSVLSKPPQPDAD